MEIEQFVNNGKTNVFIKEPGKFLNSGVLAGSRLPWPQASFLGPLLVALYTADLRSTIIRMNYHFYADDCEFPAGRAKKRNCKLDWRIGCPFSLIGEEFFDLSLNPSKSKVMLVGTPRLHERVTIGNRLVLDGLPLSLVLWSVRVLAYFFMLI